VPPFETPLIALQFAHRVGAAIVAVLSVTLVTAVFRSDAADRRLRRPAVLVLALLVTQIALGGRSSVASSRRADDHPSRGRRGAPRTLPRSVDATGGGAAVRARRHARPPPRGAA